MLFQNITAGFAFRHVGGREKRLLLWGKSIFMQNIFTTSTSKNNLQMQDNENYAKIQTHNSKKKKKRKKNL